MTVRSTRRRTASIQTANPLDAFAASLQPVVADMVSAVFTQFATDWLRSQGLEVTMPSDEPEPATEELVEAPRPAAQLLPRTRSSSRRGLVLDPAPVDTSAPVVSSDAE